jgi:hypothetical protein
MYQDTYQDNSNEVSAAPVDNTQDLPNNELINTNEVVNISENSEPTINAEPIAKNNQPNDAAPIMAFSLDMDGCVLNNGIYNAEAYIEYLNEWLKSNNTLENENEIKELKQANSYNIHIAANKLFPVLKENDRESAANKKNSKDFIQGYYDKVIKASNESLLLDIKEKIREKKPESTVMLIGSNRQTLTIDVNEFSELKDLTQENNCVEYKKIEGGMIITVNNLLDQTLTLELTKANDEGDYDVSIKYSPKHALKIDKIYIKTFIDQLLRIQTSNTNQIYLNVNKIAYKILDKLRVDQTENVKLIVDAINVLLDLTSNKQISGLSSTFGIEAVANRIQQQASSSKVEVEKFLLNDILTMDIGRTFDQIQNQIVNPPEKPAKEKSTIQNTNQEIITSRHLPKYKIELLYAQMHRLANKYANKPIEFHFYDDLTENLDALHNFYNVNTKAIPNNVTLILHQYQPKETEVITKEYQLIRGTGQPNPYYHEIVKSLFNHYKLSKQNIISDKENHQDREAFITALTTGQPLQIAEPIIEVEHRERPPLEAIQKGSVNTTTARNLPSTKPSQLPQKASQIITKTENTLVNTTAATNPAETKHRQLPKVLIGTLAMGAVTGGIALAAVGGFLVAGPLLAAAAVVSVVGLGVAALAVTGLGIAAAHFLSAPRQATQVIESDPKPSASASSSAQNDLVISPSSKSELAPQKTSSNEVKRVHPAPILIGTLAMGSVLGTVALAAVGGFLLGGPVLAAAAAIVAGASVALIGLIGTGIGFGMAHFLYPRVRQVKIKEATIIITEDNDNKQQMAPNP